MYVITGGAGFLGSACLWELNKAGIEDVIIVDNLGTSEKWKNLVGLRYTDYVHKDAFIASVRQKGLDANIKGIIHMGACSATTERDAEYLMENNFHYSQDLCKAALAGGVRFIHASSASTYGDGSLGFDDALQLLPQLRPLNMYGYTKQLFDMWLLRHGYQENVASLKFFNVYGPNEYHKDTMRSVVCKAYTEIRETGSLRLFRSNSPQYTDGGQMRDFVYVKDCTKVMHWLLENPTVNGIYNVGTGIARTWNSLATAIFKAMGQEVHIQYMEMPEILRGKYQNFTEACVTRLIAQGCPPCATSLEEGVADYVQNYLSQGAFLDCKDFAAKPA